MKSYIMIGAEKYLTVAEAARRLKRYDRNGNVVVGSTRRNIERHIERKNLKALHTRPMLIALSDFEAFNRKRRRPGRKRKPKQPSGVIWLGRAESSKNNPKTQ